MKVAFLLLAIIAIAFVVVIWRGSGPSLAGVSDTPAWLQRIGNKMKPGFDFRAIAPGCFDHETKTFLIPSACISNVSAGSASDRFRLLRLEVKTGNTVAVEFTPAPDDDSGIQAAHRTLTITGKAETFTIPAKGGTFTFHCLPPGTCAVGAA